MQNFLSYNTNELYMILASWDQPSWRARQICEWVWQRGATDYAEMSNLPQALRERLAAELPLQRATVAERLQGCDGARKYLLRFADGVSVETVGIPDTGGGPGADGARLTVCVSSQAGCALGCVFCATGRQGLTRNLSSGEIAEQVRVVGADFGRAVTNVVVMGQGEPFANYDATLDALRLLNSPQGFNIGARHLTVSTSGIITGIDRLASEPEQFRLAISLHSATQELRDTLMPGLRAQTLEKLQEALIRYRELSGRRVSLEYILLRDVNDRDSDLCALADFARATRAHINLLPYNEIGSESTKQASEPGKTSVGRVDPDAPPLEATPGKKLVMAVESEARTRQAADLLRAAGVETSIRRSRGADIAAACGQLAGA